MTGFLRFLGLIGDDPGLPGDPKRHPEYEIEDDDSEVVVWLLGKVVESAPVGDVSALREGTIEERIRMLSKCGPNSGATMLWGMFLPPEEKPNIRRRVWPAAACALSDWEDALEEAHGEMGLSFFAEICQAQNYGPYRGKPREGRMFLRLNEPPPPRPLEKRVETEGDSHMELEEKDGKIVGARIWTEWDGPEPHERLDSLLVDERARALESLTLGLFSSEGENYYDSAIRSITTAAPASLTNLFIGDFEYPDETEISWTDVGSLDPLLPACPALTHLRARGGAIGIDELAHEALESLTLETGGLPASTVRAIVRGDCPKLENLEVWFGDDNYGGDSSIADLAPLFAKDVYPSLTRLGLKNSMFQNDICRALVDAPWIGRIEDLDLSMGTMTDEGADALVAAKDALTSLKRLDVSDNFLSREAQGRLSEAYGSVVVIGRQEEPEEDYDETFFYVSVGE